MSHHSHNMRLYRELGSGVRIAYCIDCSAETDAELQQECSKRYVPSNLARNEREKQAGFSQKQLLGVDTTKEQD